MELCKGHHQRRKYLPEISRFFNCEHEGKGDTIVCKQGEGAAMVIVEEEVTMSNATNQERQKKK